MQFYLATNQVVGSSNLSGRAKFLSKVRKLEWLTYTTCCFSKTSAGLLRDISPHTVGSRDEVRKLGRRVMRGDAPGPMPEQVLPVFKMETWGAQSSREGAPKSGRTPAVMLCDRQNRDPPPDIGTSFAGACRVEGA